MNLSKIAISLALAVVIAGCTKLDLQPLSKASTETWFQNAEQVEMSLNTLYLHQFWPMFKTDWGSTAIMALDEASDDWMNRTTLTVFTNGTLSSSNSTFVQSTWEYTYKAISRSNTIIENMGRSKGNLTEEMYNRYLADARFVRACMYSRLISRFGDVIYYEHEPTLEASYKMQRTDKMEVLKHVYEDFDFAIEHLPLSYSGGQVQRATKGAALGMKARVALFFGQYEVAEAAAKGCMDLGAYTLHADFGDLFLSTTKNAAEVVFGIPRAIENNSAIHPNGVKPYLSRNVAAPSTTAQPSWDLFLAFLCKDGKTIDVSPLYNPREPFKNRDPRLSYTIVEFNTNYFGFNYTPHPDSAMCWNYTKNQLVANSDSKAGDQYASYNGLMLRKGIDNDWIDDYYANNDKIILRFADVLLMYAEAKIEQNETDQSVLDAINKVRARAYKVDYRSAGYPAVTETAQAALRKILRIERRMEFAFEGMRYDDIIRWKIAEVVMNRPNYGLPTSVANCKKLVTDKLWFFGGTPAIDENGCPDLSKMANISRYRVLSQRVFDASKNYLWPIPATELNINTNLKNNPNY
ncbi:RagB/SusD family nutrient uptake outer membrane protein [Filimonas effusa]|uniref:RagB/SusD family nutrient uptake outer membrane protein n=1 Tax=Filimonas effusa TaxID=2508721 RepID=A0A4Q1DA56_9BACT|nr:RagB/SusD family nutrient uptake outer membrane protein [Filimonas effusa]RXK85635.1 RagB/SusD family nutrient uptake outer membrane protein [Filimonas effusa]